VHSYWCILFCETLNKECILESESEINYMNSRYQHLNLFWPSPEKENGCSHVNTSVAPTMGPFPFICGLFSSCLLAQVYVEDVSYLHNLKSDFSDPCKVFLFFYIIHEICHVHTCGIHQDSQYICQ